jgi:hypothetical protein
LAYSATFFRTLFSRRGTFWSVAPLFQHPLQPCQKDRAEGATALPKARVKPEGRNDLLLLLSLPLPALLFVIPQRSEGPALPLLMPQHFFSPISQQKSMSSPPDRENPHNQHIINKMFHFQSWRMSFTLPATIEPE